MAEGRKKGDEYYPLRWKLADFVENIIILYRTRAALFLAALGVLLILVGAFIFGWRPFGSDDDEVTPVDTDTVEAVADDGELDDGGISQEEALGIPTDDDDAVPGDDASVDGVPNDATNSTIEGNIRPIATDAQLRFTQQGAVVVLGPAVMQLTGGFPSDAAAEDAAARANALFPTREVLDSQVLHETFAVTDDLLIRLGDQELFAPETAELNPNFIPLISDVTAAIQSSGDVTVEVVGHYPGPLRSTNRARAIADQLIAQGIARDIITVTGAGNTQPVPGFDTRIDVFIR